MTSASPAVDNAGPFAGGGGRLIARLRDRIAASDPAFSRLRLAARAMLSLALSGGLLWGLTQLHALPVVAYGLTGVLSFVGSLAVREPTGRGQALTRVYAGCAAVASVSVAGLLAPYPAIADLAFLPVIFAAVYVRKFGPRWFAVGMVGFMAYFLGEYLHPSPGDLVWIPLAVAVALAMTHVVGNVLLKDSPERDFRRALVTIDHRINLIAHDLIDSTHDHTAPKDDARAFQRHLARLRDIVLMAEGFIPQTGEGALAAEGPASELAIALFDLQLSVERLVRSRRLSPVPPDVVRQVLSHDRERLDKRVQALPEDADDATAARLAARIVKARDEVDAALGRHPSPAFAPVETDTGASQPDAAPSDEAATWVPKALRLPIQVTLACAIAMGAGLMLSSSRWYWAVITAFIVFNNTRSRADTAVKALQRSAGTLAGVIAGTVIATALHGNMGLSLVLLPVLFFLAFYFLQASYGVMIFLITIAIALLYGLLGRFTPELLLVRLEETVAGGIAGAGVAFVVFPARASTAVNDALSTYFGALRDLIEAARARIDEGEPRDLLGLSRALDRAYTGLADAARPLGGYWAVVTRFGDVREKLLLLAGCAHWGRVLARSLPTQSDPSSEHSAQMKSLGEDVAEHLSEAETRATHLFSRKRSGAMPDPATLPRPSPAASGSQDPALALEVLCGLLARVAAAARGHDRR